MFYLTTPSTHFIYGYMASDIWLRTILIVRKETRCRHIGYSYRLTARVHLYAPSHKRITHTTAFVTPVVEHWLEREIAQWKEESVVTSTHWAFKNSLWVCAGTEMRTQDLTVQYGMSIALLGLFITCMLLYNISIMNAGVI